MQMYNHLYKQTLVYHTIQRVNHMNFKNYAFFKDFQI